MGFGADITLGCESGDAMQVHCLSYREHLEVCDSCLTSSLVAGVILDFETGFDTKISFVLHQFVGASTGLPGEVISFLIAHEHQYGQAIRPFHRYGATYHQVARHLLSGLANVAADSGFMLLSVGLLVHGPARRSEREMLGIQRQRVFLQQELEVGVETGCRR